MLQREEKNVQIHKVMEVKKLNNSVIIYCRSEKKKRKIQVLGIQILLENIRFIYFGLKISGYEGEIKFMDYLRVVPRQPS